MIRFQRLSKGFTLIEVLAAFMVFGLVFSVILQLSTSSMRNVALSNHYTEVSLWAESMLAETRQQPSLTEGRKTGVYNDRFHWQLDISESQAHWPYAPDKGEPGGHEESLPGNTPAYRLMRVQLQVSWNNRRNQTTFVTLMHQKNDDL